jgi:hypothetical protein
MASAKRLAQSYRRALYCAQEATKSALTRSLTAVGHAARARSLNDLMYSAQGLAAANTANCNPGWSASQTWRAGMQEFRFALQHGIRKGRLRYRARMARCARKVTPEAESELRIHLSYGNKRRVSGKVTRAREARLSAPGARDDKVVFACCCIGYCDNFRSFHRC